MPIVQTRWALEQLVDLNGKLKIEVQWSTRRLGGALGLVACLATCQEALAQKNFTILELQQAFETIADVAEFDRLNRRGIRKWTEPIAYSILGRRSEKIDDEIDDHLHWVERAIGLPVTRISSNERMSGPIEPVVSIDRSTDRFVVRLGKPGLPAADVNFVIYFGSADQLLRFARALNRPTKLRQLLATGASPCFGTLFPEGDPPRIRAASIFIREGLESTWNNRCIAEELTQSFGLMNDVYNSPITLFDDVLPPKKIHLTEYDKIFLKVLYNPRMTLGLTGDPLRLLTAELIAIEVARAGIQVKRDNP